MTKLPWLGRVLLVVFGLCLVAAPGVVRADAAKPVIPPRAEPFPMRDVRLLGGPLKNAQDICGRYLLSLSADRLLSRFRGEAGLKPKAPQYPQWEDQILPGVGASFYLSGIARLYATTGDRRYLDRLTYMLDELEECQKANGDGFLLATVKAREFVTQIEAGDIRLPGGWEINGRPEPYYAMEKLFSGLRDAYRVAGQRKAMDIEAKLGDWLAGHMSHLTDDQMQRICSVEYGGMNWVLADLYADTGDAKYLALSRRWDHKAFFDPLSRGVDNLPGNHANTQFPKISGLASRYPYSGDPTDLVTARFFWDRVVYHHTYVTGGNSDGEHFAQPDHLNDRLSLSTTESCNVYNMLRMSLLLYAVEPRPEYPEYIERALWNHVVADQHPDGRVCYYLRLGQGVQKHYETLQDNFSCCVCSSMDSYAKIADYLYARDAEGLYVNQFAPSTVSWPARGVALRQTTGFPDEPRTHLSLTCAHPTRLVLRIRCPRWTTSGFAVSVNGKRQPVTGVPGNYVAIDRTWSTGDRVDVDLPMPVRTESMPDNPRRIAIFRGPILLAGKLPTPPKPDDLPLLVDDRGPVNGSYTPLVKEPMRCCTILDQKSTTVPLRPFYAMHEERYTIFWDVLTSSELAARAAKLEQEREARRQLDARTTDWVVIGDETSEKAHNMAGEETHTGFGAYGQHMETRWRDAGRWFSYDLKVEGDKPLTILCTYWGGEQGPRVFDILVDGVKIAEHSLDSRLPDRFYDTTYPIPAELTKGKQKVTIRFAAHPANTAGGLFGLRVVR